MSTLTVFSVCFDSDKIQLQKEIVAMMFQQFLKDKGLIPYELDVVVLTPEQAKQMLEISKKYLNATYIVEDPEDPATRH